MLNIKLTLYHHMACHDNAKNTYLGLIAIIVGGGVGVGGILASPRLFICLSVDRFVPDVSFHVCA